jgi:hypothetical protein
VGSAVSMDMAFFFCTDMGAVLVEGWVACGKDTC